MIPFAPFMPTQPGAAFVASKGDTLATTTTTLTGFGVLAGDLLIVMKFSGGAPTRGSAGAWTNLGNINGNASTCSVFYAVAASGDLASAITGLGTAGYIFAAYRGAKSAASKANVVGPGSNPTTFSFTKGPNHVGLFAINECTPGNINAITAPTTWTRRESQAMNSSANDCHLFDRLYPANQVYNDGATISMANSGGNTLVAASIFALLS